MRRATIRRLLPAFLLLCVVGLGAGCSDDDDEGGTASATTTTAGLGEDGGDDSGASGGNGENGENGGNGEPAEPGEDGGGEDDPIPTSSDVCGLLTPADLETAFGKPFSAGVGTNQAQCSWESVDRASNFNIVVSPADFSATRAALTNSGTEIEDIPDVGDDAYWFATPIVTQLGVGHENRTYIFGYGDADLDPAAVKDQVVSVARQAIDRL